MHTVSCSSCDAVFPASAIPVPHATRCPRCEELLTGPRRQRFSFVAPKLGPADFVHPAFCSSCGCIMSMLERAAGTSTICRFPLCHHKRAAIAARELQEKTMEQVAQKQAEDITRVEDKLREMGVDPANCEIAILPAYDRPLETMAERRKNALADRLTEIAAEMRVRPIEETTTSFSVSNPPADMALVARACATCQGECCQNGGEQAYLTRRTLTRVMAASPEMSLEDVVRAYLDRVPNQSYKSSCIYHTDKGCNLPSEMRSDTCNDFYCSGARCLSSIGRGDDSLPVIAAAIKGEKIVRLTVIREGRDVPPEAVPLPRIVF